MKVTKKAILKCSKLQRKAEFELGELSCRIEILDEAIACDDPINLSAGALITAITDLKRSIDKAQSFVGQLGIALPREPNPELEASGLSGGAA